MSLYEAYYLIIGQIISIDPFTFIIKAFAQVIQEEELKEIVSSSKIESSHAFKVKNSVDFKNKKDISLCARLKLLIIPNISAIGRLVIHPTTKRITFFQHLLIKVLVRLSFRIRTIFPFSTYITIIPTVVESSLGTNIKCHTISVPIDMIISTLETSPFFYGMILLLFLLTICLK